MRRINNFFVRATSAMALAAAVVIACGPFFGTEALRSRQQYLLAPPTISFEGELRSLVPAPTSKFPVIEPTHAYDGGEVTRESVESGELSPAWWKRVQAMRAQTSGDAAQAFGAGLDSGTQLYTSGAISFLHGDMQGAKRYFQAVLALPENERKLRELWARFMLGRIAVAESNGIEANAQFEAVRTTVANGAPDRLGLAVASLGEQARGAWRTGGVAEAVRLYAKQASYGSESGAKSLLTIANLILKDTDLLDRAVQDRLTRKLLFLCLNSNVGRPFFVGPDSEGNAGSAVDRIVQALERHGLTHVEAAGLLASAAYHQAHYDVATKLASLEDTPISAWVRAKLALRAGDGEAALKAYDKALVGFGRDGSSQLMAEAGVLRVSRSDYSEALALFYRALPAQDYPDNYVGFTDCWGDVAYLAERVLTVGELENFVDHRLPSLRTIVPDTQSVRSRLRSILARRLMRAGQISKALGYFDAPKTLAAAEQYANAMRKANSWWRWKLTRAEAWFEAATLARTQGLELLGFEKEPDFAMWDGNYEWDYNGVLRGAAKPSNPYQTEDERKRVASSQPVHDQRFQYRLTAVDYATKAADLLPPSTQGFAAVLCQSTQWVIDGDPNLARQLYGRYLRQGAYVRWGRTFGRQCPVPDFAAASNWRLASRQAGQWARHGRAHPKYGALIAVGILFLYFGVRFFRRQSKPAV